MAFLGGSFDAKAVNEQNKKEFGELLTDGFYNAYIKSCSIKPTRLETGRYLAVVWAITEADGSPTPNVVYQNINVKNQSQQAEKIGRQQLAQLCEALGLDSIQDTNQLLDIPAIIKVATETSLTWGDKNIVKGVKPSRLNNKGAAATPVPVVIPAPTVATPTPMPPPVVAPVVAPVPAMTPVFPGLPAGFQLPAGVDAGQAMALMASLMAQAPVAPLATAPVAPASGVDFDDDIPF
jgi:hypothetical protein